MTLEQIKAATSTMSADDLENWEPSAEHTFAAPQTAIIPADPGQILRSLASLRPSRADNYQEWFRVACALRSLGDHYFGLFDLWSRQSANYGRTRETWDSIHADRGITAASLHHWAREDAQVEGGSTEPFKVYSSKEFFEEDFSLKYLIDECFVYGQPMLVSGVSKTLKTSICIDAAVSLASGKRFLDRFAVLSQAKVLIMSGESGLGTLQETGRRICKSKDIDPLDLDNLKWSSEIPRCDSPADLDRLREAISRHHAEVLFIDPAYLALGGDDHANVFKQGQLLRKVNSACVELGSTLVLVHHNKKTMHPGSPPKLEDMAMAGFAEFARQWWLLNRSTAFEEHKPHELWFRVGGSAGHCGLFELKIDEGSRMDNGGRKWDVESANGRVSRQRLVVSDIQVICKLLERHPQGLTINAIETITKIPRARIKKAMKSPEFAETLVPPGGNKQQKVAGYVRASAPIQTQAA